MRAIEAVEKIAFRVCPSHLFLAKCDGSGSSRGEQVTVAKLHQCNITSSLF